MADVIVTGASRGIGQALTRALIDRGRDRLIVIARDRARLEAVVAEARDADTVALAQPGDLGSVASARSLGEELIEVVEPGATLVHNAGLWPSRRQLNADGLESSFVVNHLAGLALQAPLLEAGRLARILVVSAGLIVKGRFDRERTPTGEDFSALWTYCTTKLCFAVAMRDVARRSPDVDVLVLHPGVVRTDLGARRGVLGWLLRQVKRGWESPERCAARLAAILDEPPRWSARGEAQWRFEAEPRPWPEIATDEALAHAVRECSERFLA